MNSRRTCWLIVTRGHSLQKLELLLKNAPGGSVVQESGPCCWKNYRYRPLMEKLVVKRIVERPGRRWKGDVKVNLNEIRWGARGLDSSSPTYGLV
jgi:hypothetical protein